MSFVDKAFDAWDWFVGLFRNSYGWRDWTIYALVLLFIDAYGVGLYLLLSDEPDYPPTTVHLANGKTVHCDEGYWYGGGFGASNRFSCDGITYTINVIDHVEEEN